MPPRSRGSMRTWRSERISAPEWPASPTRVSVSTVMRSPSLFATNFGEFSVVPSLSCRCRLLIQFGQNCIGHLYCARRALADGFGAARDAHHVVSAHSAFSHDRGDGLADAARFLHFANVLEHHDRG